MCKRHTKQTASTDAGIFTKEAPIHLSNLAIADKDGKPTRVGFQIKDGVKTRVAKSTGDVDRWLRQLTFRVFVPNTKTISARLCTEQFCYKNVMQLPKLDKIVLNMGVGEAVNDTKKVKIGRCRYGKDRWPEAGHHLCPQVDRRLQGA